MLDPYLYEDVPVLKNLLGIKDSDRLECAEADITSIKLLIVDGAVQTPGFDLFRLKAIHRHIFEDIYEWAGEIRTVPLVKEERVLGGDTIRYSNPDNIEHDCNSVFNQMDNVNWPTLGSSETAEQFAQLMATLWQIHPFREGNTRTVITFATQYAEGHNFRMDKTLLKDSAAYVRDALVKASDGRYSEYAYLVKIFEEAIRRG